jgi:hypothetical protein
MPMEAVMLFARGILDVPQKIFTVSGFAQKIKPPPRRLKCDLSVTNRAQPASILRGKMAAPARRAFAGAAACAAIADCGLRILAPSFGGAVACAAGICKFNLH